MSLGGRNVFVGAGVQHPDAVVWVWIRAYRDDPAVTLSMNPPAGRHRVGVLEPEHDDVGRREGGKILSTNRQSAQPSMPEIARQLGSKWLETVGDEQEPRPHWFAPPSSDGRS